MTVIRNKHMQNSLTIKTLEADFLNNLLTIIQSQIPAPNYQEKFKQNQTI